jgi:hypothetical protein
MNLAVSCVVPCSLVQVYRRFSGAISIIRAIALKTAMLVKIVFLQEHKLNYIQLYLVCIKFRFSCILTARSRDLLRRGGGIVVTCQVKRCNGAQLPVTILHTIPPVNHFLIF